MTRASKLNKLASWRPTKKTLFTLLELQFIYGIFLTRYLLHILNMCEERLGQMLPDDSMGYDLY